VPPGGVVEIDDRLRLDVSDDDVGPAIFVQVSHGERVRPGLRDRHGGGEARVAFAEVDESAEPFVDGGDVHQAIAVEVRGLRYADGCIGCAKRNALRETALAVVQVDVALPAVAMRDNQVDAAIMIHVGGADRRR
jgi:hypothetical protein